MQGKQNNPGCTRRASAALPEYTTPSHCARSWPMCTRDTRPGDRSLFRESCSWGRFAHFEKEIYSRFIRPDANTVLVRQVRADRLELTAASINQVPFQDGAKPVPNRVRNIHIGGNEKTPGGQHII